MASRKKTPPLRPFRPQHSLAETHQTAIGDQARLTTNQCVPISDNQDSLKAGERGPVLQDPAVEVGISAAVSHRLVPNDSRRPTQI